MLVMLWGVLLMQFVEIVSAMQEIELCLRGEGLVEYSTSVNTTYTRSHHEELTLY